MFRSWRSSGLFLVLGGYKHLAPIGTKTIENGFIAQPSSRSLEPCVPAYP